MPNAFKLSKFKLCLAMVMVFVFSLGLTAKPGICEDSSKLKKYAISHLTGEVFKFVGDQRDPRRIPFRALVSELEFTLYKNDVARIYLVDYNPFQYKYQWKGITKIKIEDLSELEKLSDALKEMQEKKKDAIEKLSTAETDADKKETEIAEIQSKIDKKNAEIIANVTMSASTFSLTKTALKGLKNENETLLDEIGDLKKEKEKLQKIIEKAEKEQKELKAKYDFVKKTSLEKEYEPIIAELQGYVKQIDRKLKEFNGNWDPEVLIGCTGGWKEEIGKRIQSTYKKINKKQLDFIERYPNLIKFKIDGDNTKTPTLEEIAEDHDKLKRELYEYVYIGFLQDQKSTVLEMVKKVEAFIAIVKEFEAFAKEGVLLGTVSYNSLEIEVANIGIEKIVKDVKTPIGLKDPPKTGDFKFAFHPSRKFKLRFGVAQVWSSFKEVDEETGEETGIQLQLPMISFVPTKWEDSPIHGGLQMGLYFDQNSTQVLVGPALIFKKLLVVGAGLHIRFGSDIDKNYGGYLNFSLNVPNMDKK